MNSNDPTEHIRRRLVSEINAEPATRAQLVHEYGRVWDTEEVRQDFEVWAYFAPYVVVVRKQDGRKGTLIFQHEPRFYFSFQAD